MTTTSMLSGLVQIISDSNESISRSEQKICYDPTCTHYGELGLENGQCPGVMISEDKSEILEILQKKRDSIMSQIDALINEDYELRT